MTSLEIYQILETGRIAELYTKFEKVFEWVDKQSDELISGDLLNEHELAFMLDKATGCYAKLTPIVNALESYVERKLANEEAKMYSILEKIRTQDTSVAKSNARDAVSNVRDYLGDFKGYQIASSQMICSAQSRLKRLTVEKGARGVDYTGETPVGGGYE